MKEKLYSDLGKALIAMDQEGHDISVYIDAPSRNQAYFDVSAPRDNLQAEATYYEDKVGLDILQFRKPQTVDKNNYGEDVMNEVYSQLPSRDQIQTVVDNAGTYVDQSGLIEKLKAQPALNQALIAFGLYTVLKSISPKLAPLALVFIGYQYIKK